MLDLAYLYQSIQTIQDGLGIPIQFTFESLKVAAILCSILESLLIHQMVLLLPDMTFGLDMPLSVSNLARVDKYSAVRALKYASLW